MSKNSLLTQILMIGVAIAIVFVYIKPTISNIRMTQDTINSYEEEAEKVLAVNNLLAQQVALVDSVRPQDMQALLRYMPDTLDQIAVLKDIDAIFTYAGVKLTDVNYDEKNANANLKNQAAAAEGVIDPLAGLDTHGFNVTAEMSYAELKQLLAAFEVNNYLLQIDQLSVLPSESGLLTVELALLAFTRAPVVVDESADDVIEI